MSLTNGITQICVILPGGKAYVRAMHEIMDVIMWIFVLNPWTAIAQSFAAEYWINKHESTGDRENWIFGGYVSNTDNGENVGDARMYEWKSHMQSK